MKNTKIDTKKYGGKYIATKSFKSKEIIASGDDLVKVFNDAKDKGFDDPVINYVPKEGVICIY